MWLKAEHRCLQVMKSQVFLALLTLTSVSGDSPIFDFPEFNFSDEENSNVENFKNDVVFPSISEEFTQTDIPYFKEPIEEQRPRVNFTDILNNLEADFNVSTNQSSTDRMDVSEDTTDKYLLDYLASHPNARYSFSSYIKKDEMKPSQTQRREIKRWRALDDFFTPNSAPVPLDLNPYNIRVDENDFSRSSGYLENRDQDQPSLVVTEDHSDRDGVVKPPPQYFQKNYYYNYYPLINERGPVKWSEDISPEGRIQKSEVTRRGRSQNPCRLYLDFLKYAFNKLDDGGENYDDYDNKEYGPANYGTHHGYGTKLTGPTLYVDNSGKISQVSTNGNGVQVAEGISPESRISISTNSAKSLLEQGRASITNTPEGASSRIATTTPISTTEGGTRDYHPWYAKGNSLVKSEPQAPTTKPEEKTLATASSEVEEHTTNENRIQETTSFSDEHSGRMGEGQQKAKQKAPIDDLSTVRHLPFAFPGPEGFPGPDAVPGGQPGFLPYPHSYPYSRFRPHPHSHSYTPSSSAPPLNKVKVETVLSIEEDDDEEDCKDKMLPCPDTVNITYPLNGYCNRYVSCESGKAIRRTCPEGLHFNLIIKSCDLPHNSFCTYACPTPNGLFGIPGDCGGYFVCKNSELEYRMCPPRMHWDIRRRTCSFSEFSSCPMKCKTDNEVRHYEGDCKAYIVCLNGIPYYHKCPPNMSFNKNDLLCEPDSMSECRDDPRLLTKTLSPSALCKDVMLKMSDSAWCHSFLRRKNSTGA